MGPLVDETGLVHMDPGQQIEDLVRSGQALQPHKGLMVVPAPSRVQLARQLRWTAVRGPYPYQRRSLGPQANPTDALRVSIQRWYETHRDTG